MSKGSISSLAGVMEKDGGDAELAKDAFLGWSPWTFERLGKADESEDVTALDAYESLL